jgi:DnaJ-class molecular chaperone
MEIEPQELRGIILGKITFRKCPLCYGEGTMYWIDNIEDNISKRTYEEAGGFRGEGNKQEFCNDCQGVGFIVNKWS